MGSNSRSSAFPQLHRFGKIELRKKFKISILERAAAQDAPGGGSPLYVRNDRSPDQDVAEQLLLVEPVHALDRAPVGAGAEGGGGGNSWPQCPKLMVEPMPMGVPKSSVLGTPNFVGHFTRCLARKAFTSSRDFFTAPAS